jgi:hypothetical protein
MLLAVRCGGGWRVWLLSEVQTKYRITGSQNASCIYLFVASPSAAAIPHACLQCCLLACMWSLALLLVSMSCKPRPDVLSGVQTKGHQGMSECIMYIFMSFITQQAGRGSPMRDLHLLRTAQLQ